MTPQTKQLLTFNVESGPAGILKNACGAFVLGVVTSMRD